MINTHKKILLVLNWYLPRLHRGIVDYARTHHCFLEVAHAEFFRETVRNWRGDGIITDIDCNLKALRERGVKIALCADVKSFSEQADCVVCPDDGKIGRLAAEYFLHRGFRNFAVCATAHRRAAFCERLEQQGYSAIEIPTFYGSRGKTENRRKLFQVTHLPAPCAVFCENDWEAAKLFNIAAEARLRVPEELAILGVGNDDLLCNSTLVPLSSMETRLYERGCRIAEELDRVLNGAPGRRLMIEPSSTVIERGTTGFYATEHPVLKRMLEWLTARASTPVQVADLAAHFNLSVSAVYRMFTIHLGRSPKKLLLDVRMDTAHRLLLDTELKISAIAEEAGFPTAASFFEAFQKIHGRTPQVWRKENH